ncbi:hypothetical protein U2A4042600080 [Corynebacterium striatum]|nr:hypothetical protein U2A4042600080 [Corynebacterium striatum]
MVFQRSCLTLCDRIHTVTLSYGVKLFEFYAYERNVMRRAKMATQTTVHVFVNVCAVWGIFGLFRPQVTGETMRSNPA